MEEEVKEVRAELKFIIVIKDELIGHLKNKNQNARKEADQATAKWCSLADRIASLEM
jgi:hypothetical protein